MSWSLDLGILTVGGCVSRCLPRRETGRVPQTTNCTAHEPRSSPFGPACLVSAPPPAGSPAVPAARSVTYG